MFITINPLTLKRIRVDGERLFRVLIDNTQDPEARFDSILDEFDEDVIGVVVQMISRETIGSSAWKEMQFFLPALHARQMSLWFCAAG